MAERTGKPAGVKFGDYLRDLIKSRRLDFGIPAARCRALEDWEPCEQECIELPRVMRARDAK